MMTGGVSVVIPILNGRRFLPAVIGAILRECAGRAFEIIAIDDGSSDGSVRYLQDRVSDGVLRIVSGPRRGQAAAINAGVREARYAFICQLDQDVIVQPGWLDALLEVLGAPEVAAAQGRYIVSPNAGFWARAMGRDLELRYHRIRESRVDHVCTGNSVYRAAALHQVGLLDESLGYGADNDLSYRFTAAGYRLAFCCDAVSVHMWREHFRQYIRQQFGVGYGRLDVIARHPMRVGGDDVSGAGMILHASGMFAALCLLILGAAMWMSGGTTLLLAAAGALIAALMIERAFAGIAAWRLSGDAVAFAFPLIHVARDLAWAYAIACWAARRVRGSAGSPAHSMPRARQGFSASRPRVSDSQDAASTLVIVPAHNEAPNLPRVIRDITRREPGIDVLVIDDASTDETAEVLPQLGVRWVRLPLRTGVGGAIRAGILYAVRHGYRFVVRVDGDAQHRACDIGRLLAPVIAGVAEAAVGSRYSGARGRVATRGMTKRILAYCLSAMTARWITDPTSGYWVFGPRALTLLSRYHPGGYPEPELLLLLHRNGVRVEEVPIRMRPRLSGRTTLTWPRTGIALARTLLALMIVPLRRVEQKPEPAHD